MIPTMENLEITKRFYDELTAIQVRETAWWENLQDLKKWKLRGLEKNEYLLDLNKNENLQDLKKCELTGQKTSNSRKGQQTNQKYRNLVGSDQQI